MTLEIKFNKNLQDKMLDFVASKTYEVKQAYTFVNNYGVPALHFEELDKVGTKHAIKLEHIEYFNIR